MPTTSVTAVVLVLHWGGFLGGQPSNVSAVVAAAQARGMHAVAPAYPLGSVLAAEQWTAALAARYRRRGVRVYAYGLSAGGTLATALTQRGQLDGAVAASAPIDLPAWPTPALSAEDRARLGDLAAASPSRLPCARRSTLMLIHARDDALAPYAPVWRLSQRCHVRLIARDTGGHNSMFATTRRGLSFLADRMRVDARAARSHPHHGS